MGKVIVIAGKQRSGKDTTGKLYSDFLRANGYTTAIFKFADPLYMIHDEIRMAMSERGFDVPAGYEEKDGELLQIIGEWGRKRYGRDVWVKLSVKNVLQTINSRQDKSKFVAIFTDCRYENELYAFDGKVKGALKIKLFAPEDVRKARCAGSGTWRENTQHPSEVGLDHIEDNCYHLLFDSSQVPSQSILEYSKQFLLDDTLGNCI